MFLRCFNLCVRESRHHKHLNSRILSHNVFGKLDSVHAAADVYIGEQEINLDVVSGDLDRFGPIGRRQHNEVFPFKH